MNTNQFESNIKSILPTINASYHQNRASNDASNPYVEYRFDSVVDMEPTYLVNLIFACYDSQSKTSKDNKNIADIIQNTFNKKVFKFEDMIVHATMTIRQEIPSEMLTEKQVIELQFDLVLYENKEVIL